MKITDLRIGDVVCNKDDKFPMTVVAIFSYLGAPDDEGAVYLDFEGNEGDVLSEIVENLELCEQRYKLPAWGKEECCDTIVSSIVFQYLKIEYAIDEYDDCVFILFFNRNVGDATNCKRIGKYPTLEEAKEAAERHFNALITDTNKSIKQLER